MAVWQKQQRGKGLEPIAQLWGLGSFPRCCSEGCLHHQSLPNSEWPWSSGRRPRGVMSRTSLLPPSQSEGSTHSSSREPEIPDAETFQVTWVKHLAGTQSQNGIRLAFHCFPLGKVLGEMEAKGFLHNINS